MTGRSRSLRTWNAALLGALALGLGPAPSNAAATPKRIVSLNLCTDELVLRLADHANIASVTYLSKDPISANAVDLAADVPINHGLAEEIIPLNPDLVVAGTFTARTAVAMLKQTRFPVTEFGVARNIADVRTGVRKMAALVGEPARGEALVASFDQRLAGIGTTPTGATADRARLQCQRFHRRRGHAGGRHHGPRRTGQHRSAYESRQLYPAAAGGRGAQQCRYPDRQRASRWTASLATALLDHPVLSKLGPKTHVVVMPTNLWSCGGPEVAEAVARLHAAAEAVSNGKALQ